MQLLAIIALIWRRRRVASSMRSAWRWAARTTASTPESGRRARAAHLGTAAVGRGWRAVDTAPNAARIARLVRWLREAAAASSARSAAPIRTGAVDRA